MIHPPYHRGTAYRAGPDGTTHPFAKGRFGKPAPLANGAFPPFAWGAGLLKHPLEKGCVDGSARNDTKGNDIVAMEAYAGIEVAVI